MRYEVRCCCQPDTLLGWLDGPERSVDEKPAPFYVDGHRVRLCRMDYREIVVHERDCYDTIEGDPVELITCVKVCVYGDDRPIEFWRALPGFEEAHP